MPTREEIARAFEKAAEALVAERTGVRHSEVSRKPSDWERHVAREAVRAYLLALPSPVPVGEAALLARAEAAEAALRGIGLAATKAGSLYMPEPPAQQTAAAEAREEGR